MLQRLKKEGGQYGPPFGGAPKLEQEPVPSARFVRSRLCRLQSLSLSANAVHERQLLHGFQSVRF